MHGFPGYEFGDTIPTLVQVLNGVKPANTAAIRSMYAPSLKYEYSGGGTTISQLIVQDITGQAYDQYMWENVLKPLGMLSSSYTQPLSPDKKGLLATAYYNDGKPVKGKYHIYPEQAAAGLWTNPSDLAQYILETQLALEGKSHKVLSREMTTLRLHPYIDSSAAFGVFILNKSGDLYFSHGGVDEGFVSQYAGSLKGGNGVVVMANTYNTAILWEIINSVARVYQWKDFYTPVIKKEIPLPDSLLQAYAGNYQLDKDTISVIKAKDGLYLNVGEMVHWKMYFSDSTHFFVWEENILFNFERNAQQQITGLTVNKSTATRIP